MLEELQDSAGAQRGASNSDLQDQPQCWVHCHLCRLAGYWIPRWRKAEVVKREDGVLGVWRDPERADEMRPGLIGISLSRWPSLSHRNRESGWRSGGSLHVSGGRWGSLACWQLFGWYRRSVSVRGPWKNPEWVEFVFLWHLTASLLSYFALYFYVSLTPSQG